MVDQAPEILEKAISRVDETVATTGGTTGEQLWQLVLRRPWAQVRERMLNDGHEGRLLRSNTPFAFVIPPIEIDERRRLWRQAKQELLAERTS